MTFEHENKLAQTLRNEGYDANFQLWESMNSDVLYVNDIAMQHIATYMGSAVLTNLETMTVDKCKNIVLQYDLLKKMVNEIEDAEFYANLIHKSSDTIERTAKSVANDAKKYKRQGYGLDVPYECLDYILKEYGGNHNNAA